MRLRALRARPPGPSRRRKAPILGLLPLVVLLAVWELVGEPESALFPPPSTWWDAWQSLVESGGLWSAVGATITTLVLALAVATALGATLGALIGASRLIDRATSPAVNFLMSVPPPTIVPVAVLVLGVGRGTEIVVIVFAAIWPILLNTAAAMRSVPSVRIEMAHMLGLTRAARARKVVLPSLIPGIALGVLVAAPITIVVTLLVEMLTSAQGLGFEILQSQRQFLAAEVFALLVAIGLIGYLLNLAVTWTEAYLLRNWPEGGRR